MMQPTPTPMQRLAVMTTAGSRERASVRAHGRPAKAEPADALCVRRICSCAGLNRVVKPAASHARCAGRPAASAHGHHTHGDRGDAPRSGLRCRCRARRTPSCRTPRRPWWTAPARRPRWPRWRRPRGSGARRGCGSVGRVVQGTAGTREGRAMMALSQMPKPTNGTELTAAARSSARVLGGVVAAAFACSGGCVSSRAARRRRTTRRACITCRNDALAAAARSNSALRGSGVSRGALAAYAP